MRSPESRLMTAVFLVVTIGVGVGARAADGEQQVLVTEGPVVSINGDPWTPQSPPLRMKGVVLVPMRELFEALRAEITWDAEAKMVLAARDGKSVNLWVGRPVAVVNNVPQTLSVPPLMLGDILYVPAAVAAAAFDGEVAWDAGSETLALNFPGETLGQVTGTLIQVYPGPPGALLLFHPDKGQYRALSLAENVSVQLQQVGRPATGGTLQDLHSGDLVVVTLDEEGSAARIRSQHQLVEGAVGGVDQGVVLLETGERIKLMDVTDVVDEQGNAVAPDRIGPGAIVRARVNPVTMQTSRLVLLRLAPPPTAPEIRTFTVIDLRRGYAPGATIKVRLMGTAGGKASFDVLGFAAEVLMEEVRTGVYRADWVVPAGAQEKPCTMVAHLRVGGQDVTVPLQETFWVDGVAPVINQTVPEEGATVQTARPTISVQYTEAGSGVDPQTVKLLLDGQDVSAGVVLGTGTCQYEVPEALALGAHEVRFEMADVAGNKASAVWRFQVMRQAAQKIEYVRHNGAGALARGEKLEVTVGATESAQRCWVQVGALQFDLQPDEARRVFTGSHVVGAADVMQGAQVVAHLVDAGGRQYSLPAEATATLRGDWPGVIGVTSPTQGQVIRAKFKVSGYAKPGSDVRVTVTYLKKRILVFQGNLYEGTLTAAEDGTWETPEINPEQPLIGLSDSYKVIAELLDAEGRTKAKVEVPLVGG